MSEAMQWWAINPLDTLFFRDGRPFNSGEGGNLDATSVFPPSPRTVAGSLKATIASGQGWLGGDTPFSPELHETLNHKVYFRGPFITYKGKPLFATPSALVRQLDVEGNLEALLRSEPRTALMTDMGAATRLCSVQKSSEGAVKDLEGTWITVEGLQAFLNGEVPKLDKSQGGTLKSDEILNTDLLWSSEPRIGLTRVPNTRVAEERKLYQVSHTRLREQVGLCSAIGQLPKDYEVAPFNSMGGEARMVGFESMPTPPTLPLVGQLQAIDGWVYYTVVLITPLSMYDTGISGWNTEASHLSLAALPGELISMALGKPTWIGGWDSVQNVPKAAGPHFPSGTVFFLKAEAAQLEPIRQLHNTCIAKDTDSWHFGFGHVMIGTWRHP
jgi:CRISPR-associated protein Cmr3